MSPRLSLAIGLGAFALALRMLASAGGSIIPESDETGYLSDGLLLLEGLTPGYKHVPNAVMNWLVLLYAGVQTLAAWFGGLVEISAPALTRPLLAMEHALFVDYADLNGLRLMVIVLQVVAGTGAVVAVAWRGHLIAGTWGAVLAGALAAATPFFVEFTRQTRSYSLAWSLGLLAFAALAIAPRSSRAMIAGALIGLALATRIEMVLVLVPLILELMQREESGRRRLAALQCLAVTAVVFLVAAPWYVTSLVGNLRQIISVRLLSPDAPRGYEAQAFLDLILTGVALPLVGTIVVLLLTRPRGSGVYTVAIGLWMAALALAMRPSVHGLRHEGALFLLSAVMAPVALARASEATRNMTANRVVAVVATLLALHIGLAGMHAAWVEYGKTVRADPVAWLEQNVPEGATVYWVDGFKMPLPTPESADAVWGQVTHQHAWLIKYRQAARRLALGDRVPRAMSEDPMALEEALRRRWFILGAMVDSTRRRFNLRPVAEGTSFAASHLEVVEVLCTRGGTYAYYGRPVTRLGPPTMVWLPRNQTTLNWVIYSFDERPEGAARRC